MFKTKILKVLLYFCCMLQINTQRLKKMKNIEQLVYNESLSVF